MSSVIADDAYIPVAAKVFHERDIPLLVFAHAMGDLYDSFASDIVIRSQYDDSDPDSVMT